MALEGLGGFISPDVAGARVQEALARVNRPGVPASPCRNAIRIGDRTTPYLPSPRWM
jgi:hypothetical protein